MARFLDCITQANIEHNFDLIDVSLSDVEEKVPALTEPDVSSTYSLKATVDSEGEVTYAWVKDSAEE